ncbi:bifunctional phosphopantothenoylcysteine decarboxylase/phosphopantothenate--cysteine ligase CoaBC [uncultured Ezakiella sp.]|uniref:bifunctional phosphopantothenoylcysteine decarboxylase/phosphopantothenate--cysteine ligase CoaBC n=1 Tax=uncultured Ezakiella sp. TaxID=1637529 RepID=UPI0025EB967C|nr:bifunctional phosphopantothenoylcysteine decarboxylase/phosphopantothenate--cysteine ligase CoaBC [uncultured Ezakiella sp.]
MFKDKRVLLGVTGGVAAYKAIEIASRLKKMGAMVDVCLTENALHFVTPLAFSSITGRDVYVDGFEMKDGKIPHIYLGEADYIIVAPATKNFIAKLRAGICDNLLLNAISASEAKAFIAPAMNTKMYLDKTNLENIEYLKSLGYYFIEPDTGLLACNDVGIGKLPSPESILNEIISAHKENSHFANKKVIVTSGPTVSQLDPVRIFTNRSSGKMGLAIARELKNRGANVVYISRFKPEDNFYKYIDISTTSDMLEAVKDEIKDSESLFMAAAPLDYEFDSYAEEKIKKSDSLEFKLVRTKDILKTIAPIKGDMKIIGFAAESEKHIEYGKEKLDKKDMDFIVINNIKGEKSAFGSDSNSGIVLSKDNKKLEIKETDKNSFARLMIDFVEENL